MTTLEQVWLDAQGDLDQLALFKTANGSLQPITKKQLIHILARLEPGQSITVGGLNISLGEGDRLEVTSTSPSAPPAGLAKAAAQREAGWRTPSFGEALEGLYVLGGGDDDI